MKLPKWLIPRKPPSRKDYSNEHEYRSAYYQYLSDREDRRALVLVVTLVVTFGTLAVTCSKVQRAPYVKDGVLILQKEHQDGFRCTVIGAMHKDYPTGVPCRIEENP